MAHKHEAQLTRLSRIEGQVRGIRKMIEEGRYCVEVAQQIKATRAALKEVGLGVLDGHMRTCVADAMRSRKEAQLDEKIAEVVSLVRSWE